MRGGSGRALAPFAGYGSLIGAERLRGILGSVVRLVFRVALLVALTAAVAGCDARPRRASLDLRFEPDALRDRVAAVELSVVEGGCGGARAVYRTEIPAEGGEALSAPSVLDPGDYGIRAEARDATCRVYATGCTEVTFPRDDGATVTVTMEPVAERGACLPVDLCDRGLCMPAGPAPDGGCAPASETCNASDDDCDGAVDEGFDLLTDPQSCGSCGHACRVGVSCSEGVCADEVLTDLSAGGLHTCVLRQDGAVFCWGDNDVGQIGDGSRWTRRAQPSRVVDLDDAVDVGAGRSHACAVRSGGEVRCWGRNYEHQLGDGTTSASTVPVAVMGVTGAVQVDGGRQHTCARTEAGAVFCWGANGNGQLGDGTTTERGSAVQVEGVTGAEQVEAGDGFTCARVTSGEVLCWGGNDQGQLGDGTTTARGTAAPVMGIAGAVDLAVFDDSACAALDTGAVHCWGQNDDGELGDGTTADRTSPVPVMGVSAATRVALGLSHGCAVMDGALSCWGDNPYGQLGDGTTDDRPVAVPVPDLADVASVAAGERHTCALRAAGQVVCWGDRLHYQIGDGDIAASAVPLDVMGLPGPAAAIDPGDTHTCARLVDGRVACWGSNGNGQLGDGTRTARRAPVAIGAFSDAQQVSAARDHTCALRAGGAVWCWGRNDFGQLGDGSTTDRDVPAPVAGLAGVVHVSAGYYHACAVLGDGTIRCWGDNDQGQLGDGTTTTSSMPVAVPGITGATRVEVGIDHTCAIVAGGAMRCWGGGNAGQLGDGSTFDGPRLVPVAVLDVPPADALSLGSEHSCALAGSEVWCWGYNANGRLGAGTVGWDWGAREPVFDVSDAIALDAGGASTCVVRADGTAACWGANGDGQLGDGTFADRPAPVVVTGLADVAQIAMGGGHACAVRADGTAACWGDDRFGELGDGRPRHVAVPTPILPP